MARHNPSHNGRQSTPGGLTARTETPHDEHQSPQSSGRVVRRGGRSAWLARREGWLVLAAGPPLVLRELAPLWLQAAALGWLGLLWLARRWATGRWTVATAPDLPLVALLATLPGALYAAAEQAGPLVRPAGELLAVGASRLECLVFSVALYYALANAVDSPARAWSSARWLLVAGFGLSAVGWLGMTGKDTFSALAPFVAQLPRVITEVPHPVLRGGVHSNTVAALLVLLWPLAVALLVWPHARGASSAAIPRGMRLLARLFVITTLPLFVLSQSRGAWMALTAALGLLAALRWPRLRGVVAGAMALVLLGTVAFVVRPAILSAGGSGAALAAAPAPASAAGRFELWVRSLDLVAAYPWRGIGLGTFPLVFGQDPRYPGVYVYQGFAHAHNILLQAALDYGLPGLTAVVGLYVALASTAQRAIHRLAADPLAPVVAGLACGLAGLALHGLVDAVAIGSKSGVVAWALAGLLAAIRVHSRSWAAAHVSARDVPTLMR